MTQEFCASFWPTGWLTQLVTALLVSATLINVIFWRSSQVAIAVLMWASYVGARIATETGEPLVAAFVCLIAAVAAIPIRTETARLIATLWVLRVVVLSLGAVRLLPVIIMWDINLIAVILQIALLAGGAHDGGIRIIDRLRSDFGRVGARSLDIVKGGAVAVVKAIAGHPIFGRKT